MHRLASTACLLAAWTLSAIHATGETWHKVASAHFEVFTTAGEKRGREVARQFEQVRGFFLKTLKGAPGEDRLVRVIAFRNEKEYKPYRANEFAAAFYVGGPDRDTIVLQVGGSEYFPIAVHEYVHLLVKHSGLELPLWLNEGFADLYSTLMPVGRKLQVGAFPLGRLLVLRDDKWLDLETLMTAGHGSPHYNERDRAGVFYAQSWALTHMLNLSDAYRTKFNELTSALLAGGRPSEAFERVYGKTLAGVQKDLRAYVNASTIQVVLFDFQLDKAAETPAVATATPLESGLALANLLANMRRPDEARAAYERLAAEHTKSWEVEEGLGYLSWQKGENAEAQRHFVRAADLGASNPRMYVAAARLSRHDPQVAIRLLGKALEIEPEMKEACYELGFAHMSARQYSEAVKSFQKVRKVTPEEAFPMFHAIAHALSEMGQKDEARKFAARAGEQARTEAQRADIQRLLEYINFEPAVAVVRQVVSADTAAEPAAPSKTLRRRPHSEPFDNTTTEAAAGTEFAPPQAWLEGKLTRIDCKGQTAILHLQPSGGGRIVPLAILDPGLVAIHGRGDGVVDLTCGLQKNSPVRIGLDPKEDTKLGALGVVKRIEFQ